MLTGGTQDRITTETIRAARIPRRKALVKDMLIVLNMFIKIQIMNPGLEDPALFWPLKGDLQDSLKFDVSFFINKGKGLRGVYLYITEFIKDYEQNRYHLPISPWIS